MIQLMFELLYSRQNTLYLAINYTFLQIIQSCHTVPYRALLCINGITNDNTLKQHVQYGLLLVQYQTQVPNCCKHKTNIQKNTQTHNKILTLVQQVRLQCFVTMTSTNRFLSMQDSQHPYLWDIKILWIRKFLQKTDPES